MWTSPWKDKAHMISHSLRPYCQNSRGVPEISYPWVNLKNVFDKQAEKRLRKGKARPRGLGSRDCTWAEFLVTRQRIRSLLDTDLLLPPSTQFGMFEGKVYSRPEVTDLVMPDPVTLLARRTVAQRLNDLGNNLRICEVKLKQQKGQTEDIVHVWAPPVAKLGPSAQVDWCVHCERGSVRKSDAVDKSNNTLRHALIRGQRRYLLLSYVGEIGE